MESDMDFDHPPADPLAVCKIWLDEAETLGLINPLACSLATIDPDGRPSSRTVLMKALDERGAVFYTNRLSRKGKALQANPRASMLFYWDMLARQILIEGRVSEVSDEESDAYFATRPRGTQIGAWASRQSDPIADRVALNEAVAEIEQRFEGREVTRPPHWGGYRLSLDRIEFWQGLLDRLHDRIEYVATDHGTWNLQRLNP